LRHDDTQRRQMVAHGCPDIGRRHVLIVLPAPAISFRAIAGILCFQLVGQPARSFRNDFEAARDGIENSKVVAESASVIDRLVLKLPEGVSRDRAMRFFKGLLMGAMILASASGGMRAPS
jgi:hypothetical protein